MTTDKATPTPPADAALADALEHAGTRAEFHPDSEIAVLCRKAAAALRARAVPVDDICNAYESGVGHNGRTTANVNPYPPGTPQHTAYELGAKGTKHSAAAVPEGWSLAAHPDGGIVVQHRTLGGCFVTEAENQPREIPGQILFYLASDMLAASKAGDGKGGE